MIKKIKGWVLFCKFSFQTMEMALVVVGDDVDEQQHLKEGCDRELWKPNKAGYYFALKLRISNTNKANIIITMLLLYKLPSISANNWVLQCQIAFGRPKSSSSRQPNERKPTPPVRAHSHNEKRKKKNPPFPQSENKEKHGWPNLLQRLFHQTNRFTFFFVLNVAKACQPSLFISNKIRKKNL